MDSRIGEYVVPIFMKRLYVGNGELHIREAIHFIRKNSPKSILETDEEIRHWLRINSNYFKLKRNVIVGITGARLCEKHCNEPGSCRGGYECGKLHICRFFMLSNEFKCRDRCRFGHDFGTQHNRELLRKYKLLFLKDEHLRCLFRRPENRNEQTLPDICRAFNTSKCERTNCRFLHICNKYFVGKCPFGNKCRVSHVIDGKILSELNDYAIYLPKNVPDGLRLLCCMYKSANEQQFPANNTTGRLSRAGSSYDLLHDGAPNPEISHDDVEKISAKLSASLRDLSLPPESRQKKRPSKTHHKLGPKRNKGICMKVLSGRPCSAEECQFHHKMLPYQWQNKISSEDDWKDFDPSTNEDLEEKYCQLYDKFTLPGKNGFIRCNFETMEFSILTTEGNLRRLGTASSVAQPNSNWSTIWIWYWKSDSDCWVEYDANNPESPPLSSSEIEQKYLSNKEGELHFIHKRAVCIIDFKEMFQMDGEKTAVLRRPKLCREINKKGDANKFKSKPKTKNKQKRRKSSTNVKERNDDKSEPMTPPLMTDSQVLDILGSDSDYQYVSKGFNETMEAKSENILGIETFQNQEMLLEFESESESESKPETRKSPTSSLEENDDSIEIEFETDFQIVELFVNDSDFQYVSKKFNETMKGKGATILGIEVIQNEELLEEYERRKNKMTKKLGIANVNEVDLFHGTNAANVSAIAKQGFDVRLSGEEVGIRFGKGSYFTKKADYAHKYLTPEEDGICKMLLVKILAGRSCKGKMTYVRPPLIDPDNREGDLYNSCVDDVKTPNVFVIFANDQMHPAYIITYEMPFDD